MSPCQRICLWSGPRNVSTALMYSFAQRSDTTVVDEPLYAHYLRVSGAVHPGRGEVLASQSQQGDLVVRDVILGPCTTPVLFVKQMTHHLLELDRSFLAETTAVLLVRDPVEMLPSLVHQIPQPELADTGYRQQWDLFEDYCRRGDQPVVLDARQLLLDPESILRQLCERLGLAFESAMLGWPAGARPEDGIWAPHWYHNVHCSSGFQSYRKKTEPFPERLRPLLDQCLPYYDRLAELALCSPGKGSLDADRKSPQ